MDNIIRVFIGAPSDVNPEREIIKKVINNMNKYYRGTGFSKFDLIEVKKDVRSDIGSGLEAQEVIDENIGDYDLFIGILWKRFGTPTKTHESGTQQEFENALKNGKEVMFYFSKLPVAPDEIDPKQLEKILNFKNDIGDKGFYFEYSSLDEFEELIENNLRILAIEKNNKEPQPTKKFEKEEENEEKSMFELIESTLNNFKEVENDSKELSALFNSLNEDFENINPPREDNIQSYKIYSNSVADILNELSIEFKDKKNDLLTHYSGGINGLIESLELFGEYMDENTRQDMKKSIETHIEVLNTTTKQMHEIIEMFDTIPPMTNKLIRAKGKFIKNIKELQKDVKNLRSLLYKSLIELNDSSKY